MENNSNNRPSWSSQLAFILAAVGSAVGLGNIWRFPYVMGKNGGAVFLVVYLSLILFVCVIPLLGELILGKITKKDPVGAYEIACPKAKPLGWLNVVTSVLISSFYFVVGGWIIFYLLKSFSLSGVGDFGSYFGSMVSKPVLPVILTFVFLFSCVFFIYRGVNKGIELANKIMMPIFAVILIVLTIVSLRLPNAQAGLDFMFYPDFSKLNISMVLSALGQALFTLSIGMGAILTYGSYMKEEDNVLQNAYTIIVADTVFALLAGIMIFPAVFAFGLEPDSGAGLVFITLPKIFAQMPFGNIVSMGFFSLLLFAALTSGISIIEVSVASLMENFKITRAKSATIITLIIGALSVPVSLSFGLLSEFKVAGMTLFDLFDFVTSNICLPFNSFVICLLAGWGLKLSNDYIFKNQFLHKLFMFMIRFVLPVALLGLIIVGLRG